MARSDKDLSKIDIITHHSGGPRRVAIDVADEHLELSETDIRPPEGRTMAIGARSDDQRDWLKNAPHCELLSQYQILHLGVAEMPAPFRIVRTNLGGSYFLASLEGQGRVLVDGRFVNSLPGHAFLLPPRTMQAFFTSSAEVWRFCWVRFQETPGQIPLARSHSPVLAKFNGSPLALAIEGLRAECVGNASPANIDNWLRVVHAYVTQFALPQRFHERLRSTWQKVEQALDEPWTITQLARECCVSEKQFQRLCRRELGRTPQQQLIWLRMRRASELITQGGHKVQAIAAAVGYQNPFVFSSTFKRVTGWSPSDYPKIGARK